MPWMGVLLKNVFNLTKKWRARLPAAESLRNLSTRGSRVTQRKRLGLHWKAAGMPTWECRAKRNANGHDGAIFLRRRDAAARAGIGRRVIAGSAGGPGARFVRPAHDGSPDGYCGERVRSGGVLRPTSGSRKPSLSSRIFDTVRLSSSAGRLWTGSRF